MAGRNFRSAAHLPNLRDDRQPQSPEELPRQRKGVTPQMHGRYPDYNVLDQILEAYVEKQRAPKEIAVSLKLPLELVQEIARKVNLAEYKRQQAAPGLKVTTKAFGIGRRYPIAQRFTE